VQVLKKCDDWERRTGYFRQRKKKVKTKFIDLDHAGSDKLLNQLLLSLGCWLMLVRRFCVYNAGLKVDVAWEILIVIMTSNDENIRSCKRHTVVHHAFCFWQLLCPFLASQLTTMSLDKLNREKRNSWQAIYYKNDARDYETIDSSADRNFVIADEVILTYLCHRFLIWLLN